MYSKIIVTFCLLFVVVISFAEVDRYTTRYDDVDFDAILNNERLLKNYIRCLLDEGPCTADGAELKRLLPDALQSECKKCSVKQKEGAERMWRKLMERGQNGSGDEWKQLEARYDPNGVYLTRFEAEQKKINDDSTTTMKSNDGENKEEND